jgi:hypothetical protein
MDSGALARLRIGEAEQLLEIAEAGFDTPALMHR